MITAHIDRLVSHNPSYFNHKASHLHYLPAHPALPEPREVGVVVGVGGPRLGGRQVRVEVEGGDVVLEQLPDPEREIVVPENMAWKSLLDGFQ